MHAISRLLALGLTAGALLTATSLPAAAQGFGSSCAVASDTVVSQALGPTAHSMGGLASGTGLDICAVTVGAQVISLMHIANATGPALNTSDAQAMFDAMSAAGPTAPGGGAGAAATLVQTTPVSGVGDAAVLMLLQQPGVGSFQSLIVQHGSDVFSFNTDDSTDAQTQLVALATAVLANLGD
jgi:hypothetical protein